MALNKVWLGTTSGDFDTYTNWQKISLRSSEWSWTASGSGTNEYYLRTSGGADPALGAHPGTGIYINGSLATEGTAGSLSAGQWDYGDNDTLGYSTVYVRLSGGGDPDAQDNGYIQLQAIPNGADPVTISGLAVNGITSNTDASALSAAVWKIEAGFRNFALGSPTAPLRITPSAITIEGAGTVPWYINIGSANISPTIISCPKASNGINGLYLSGSNIATLNVESGDVAVAGIPGDTSTLATLRVNGPNASVRCASGVSLTTAVVNAGIATIECAATTITVNGGECETTGSGAVTTMNVRGGKAYPNSTGTISTLNIDGGIADFTTFNAARTVTTINVEIPSYLKYDPSVITVTNQPAITGAVSIAYNRAT